METFTDSGFYELTQPDKMHARIMIHNYHKIMLKYKDVHLLSIVQQWTSIEWSF